MRRLPNVDETARDEPDMQEYELACRLQKSNPREALSRLEALADRGSILSLRQLTYAYANGVGIEVASFMLS